MELGKVQKLKVIKKVDFGVYLGTEEEKVLLPKNEMTHPLEVGDEVEIFLGRDSSDRLLATITKPVAQVGECAMMTVKEVNKYGAFLDWGLGKDLFLPYKEQTTMVKSGDEVLIAVYLDKSNRLCGTMNVYTCLKSNSTYKEEDMVKGIIYNYIPQYGAFVAVDNKYHGLIQSKELTIKPIIGQVVEARVKSVKPDGKLDLALRQKAYIQIDDDAEKIYEFIKNNGGQLGYGEKVSPEKIKEDFQMSKNEFKRAIGKLFKEKRIYIEETNIILNK